LSTTALALERLEQRLSQLITEDDESCQILIDAARYTLFAPSKRLRPLIVLSLCPEALDIACAIECVHTYSLIHDDLPCMDDDNMRRGKKSLHVETNEWLALLSGDYLLTRAFEILARAPMDAKVMGSCIRCLSRCAGADGMIGGQVADMAFQSDPAWATWLNDKTTGRRLGARSGLAGTARAIHGDDLIHLKKAGLSFGIAFQLADDLADHDHKLSQETVERLFSEQIERFEKILDQISFDVENTRALCLSVFSTSPSAVSPS